MPPFFLRHLFFFFNDTAPPEIYTLSLHDALPIAPNRLGQKFAASRPNEVWLADITRSEEHTSELQSRRDLVCRLLLEKKNHKGWQSRACLYHENCIPPKCKTIQP